MTNCIMYKLNSTNIISEKKGISVKCKKYYCYKLFFSVCVFNKSETIKFINYFNSEIKHSKNKNVHDFLETPIKFNA